MSKYQKLWQLIQKANPEQKKEIINNLSDEDLIQLRYQSNPYRKPIYAPKTKFLEFSFINTQQDYLQNLMMTTMVGFIYKMASEYDRYESTKYVDENVGEFANSLNDKLKEYNKFYGPYFYDQVYLRNPTRENEARWLRAIEIVHPEINKAKSFCQEHKIVYEAMFPIEKQPPPEIYEILKEEIKGEKGIKKTLQDKIRERQDHILDFLDVHFQFDPNNHIRCGYMPNYEKKLQEKLQTNPENFKRTENGMLITDKFEQYLIPPADTFHSFRAFYENNYEYLRQCTDDIYGKNFFECAVIARETFDDEDKANVWENKYKNDFDTSVMRIPYGSWIFIDPWTENREKIRFDDEKTRLITEILEKKKEDEKLGRELLKKKGKKMKGRVDPKDMPFTSEVERLGAFNTYNENDVEVKVYSTKLIRSRRPNNKQYMTSSSIGIDPEPPVKIN